MQRTIFTGFYPNTCARDVRAAFGFLFLPWRWGKLRKGHSIGRAEKALATYQSQSRAWTYDSGRTALYYALKALGVGPGDHVLVQAYTCAVVVFAITQLEATPIFIDILDDFTMDPTDAQRKITSKTKVLIMQHTFGAPANIESLMIVAQQHALRTIEDCAHSLGAMYNGNRTGTYADIGMFSFGSDKVISCSRGGALTTDDETIAASLDNLQVDLPVPPLRTVIRHLLTIILFWIAKPLYHLRIGHVILYIAKRLHITSRIMTDREKRGQGSAVYPRRLANALAHILCQQLAQVDTLNEHRKTIANQYSRLLMPNKRFQTPLAAHESSIHLRYPVLCEDPDRVHRHAKSRGILLGDWYSCVVAPCDIAADATYYVEGSCPRAEALALHSLNLPTHRRITMREVSRVGDMLSSL
jgi:perosamine synthetase